MKKKILVDLSYIHSENKLNESVALYAFRFLRSLSEIERSSFVILLIPEMEKLILSRIGDFRTMYFRDISRHLIKIPYLKGFLRKFNWVSQIQKLDLTDIKVIYIPFCWSGNSGMVKIPKVITIHDLRPMREPNRALTGTVFFKMLGLGKIYLRTIRKYYTKHMKNASRVIAISEYVASDIKQEWAQYSDKVTTVYNSVAKSSVHPLEINSLDKIDFILYVNTLTEYKNIKTLVNAFALLKENTSIELKLVIVGKETDYWSNIIAPLLIKRDISKDVVHIQYAKKEELIWLYQNARMFVTPSIHEGFGYTPIEAALEGCPVISSRCESLPDVTAEKVRYYDPPTSSDNLYKEIERELKYPTQRSKLESNSKYFADRYSLATHKKKIINILNQL